MPEEYTTGWLGPAGRSRTYRERVRSHVPDGAWGSVRAILHYRPFTNDCKFDEETRARAECMVLVHDIGEAVIGDITPFDGISRGK